jgi:hypothetical protein
MCVIVEERRTLARRLLVASMTRFATYVQYSRPDTRLGKIAADRLDQLALRPRDKYRLSDEDIGDLRSSEPKDTAALAILYLEALVEDENLRVLHPPGVFGLSDAAKAAVTAMFKDSFKNAHLVLPIKTRWGGAADAADSLHSEKINIDGMMIIFRVVCSCSSQLRVDVRSLLTGLDSSDKPAKKAAADASKEKSGSAGVYHCDGVMKHID